jgi:hypothetical protein
MMKRKIKLVIILVPLLLAISALTGCIAANAIQTKHWDHINTEGTGVRLWGYLILGENFHNWNAYFVYDTEFHDDWQMYEYTIEADNYDNWNFFSVDIYGLDRLTEYHYRAVGEHEQQGATIRVGVDHTFIPGGPRVIVKNASGIGVDEATLEGELTHMGGDTEVDVFFRWGTDPDNLDMETPRETMYSTGEFSYKLTGLSSCQTIYYKAVGDNDADTWDSFWTLQVTPGLPIVETFLPHEVTETSAKFRGKLFNLGGTPTCDVWFEYGDDNPNQLDEVTDSIMRSTTGAFNIVWNNLTPDTTYWTRAVANNGYCEHKGEVKEFRTLGPKNKNPYPTEDVTTEASRPIARLIELLKDKFSWLEGLGGQYPLIERFLNR